ncbi:hypothetical protein SAMN02745781_01456 [Vibrio gazogenes DSM 21264]|uniref:Uncharacterized protein n=1 Tax=Vibrio gazogenes DSM 21264 = NBRC 103151 TaxID=1123492 RepID=A0A1M4YWC6_VIBGA|nr:hypothetical protein SAMN02745781_01456 [Vibrio gazogenes DSM 21264] [Vibrio gazogenes DSM 21264 = NBRC 103151]SJN56406.1 hypothetical protein BQ6471_02026 [Vibrio gazogenes]
MTQENIGTENMGTERLKNRVSITRASDTLKGIPYANCYSYQ